MDIRNALSKVSPIDSRKICVQGLDSYLTAVVSDRLTGSRQPSVVAPVVVAPVPMEPPVE